MHFLLKTCTEPGWVGSEGFPRVASANVSWLWPEHAQVWERQALLRSRPVAGSEQLAEAFAARRGAILRSPLPEELIAEMHRIRQRMETELAGEVQGRWDLKTGRGGLLDVETVVQLRQLQHGGRHPELLEPSRR